MIKLQRLYMNVINQQIGHYVIKDYEKFIESLIKFDKNGIIIQQKNLLIDVPNQTIQYILNNCNCYLNVNDFKQTFKNSKHWNNIKNINFDQIYFGIFNFENMQQIEQYHLKCFQFSDQQIKSNSKLFYQSLRQLGGFCTGQDFKHVICLNTNQNDIIETLYHQLSHFIQKIGNIRIIQKSPSNTTQNYFKSSFLDKEASNKVLTYFSSTQFIPHLDDVTIDLKKVQQKFYFNDKYLFFKQLNQFLKENKKKSFKQIQKTKFFDKFKIANLGNISSLIMLIAAWKMNFKVQKIYNFLYSVFIGKER